MASNLRVDTILPSTGTSLGIGTASGTTTVTNNLSVTGTINAASATITGNLGVGGVLTYEDVTNIDSVGIITARAGVNLTGGVINSAGNINCTSGRFQRGSSTVQDGDAIAGGININGTDMDASVIMSVFGNDGDFTRISGSKSRNASVGSHTIVQNNDVLLSLKGFGSDGTNFEEAAQIEMQVDGTPGNNVMPGRIVFKTATTDGTVERLRIDSSGYVTKPSQFHIVVQRNAHQNGYNPSQNFGTGVVYNAVQTTQGTTNAALDTSNGRVTVPVAGIYFLEGSAYSSTAAFTQGWFTKNGSRLTYSDFMDNSGLSQNVNSNGFHKLAANDAIGFKAYGSQHTSVTVQSNAYHTWMRITLVG